MWLLDYVNEIESDLSAFHRIDDVDDVTIGRYLRLVGCLPAYQGAFHLSLRKSSQPAQQPTQLAVAPRQEDPDNTPEDEVQRKWAATLAQTYPDAVIGGIERVTDTEMERLLASG